MNQGAHKASAWILLSSLVVFILTPTSAEALDPNENISQYAHSAWLVADGYFTSSPNAVSQTTDGYIWVGTLSGLFRFDGSKFSPFTFPKGERLPSNAITALLGAQDGSLWIGTTAGIAHLVDQRLVIFPGFHDSVTAIVADVAGHVWFSRAGSGPATYGPICGVSGSSLHCLDQSDGIAPMSCCADALVSDNSGNLWVGGDKGLIRWRPGSSTTFRLNSSAMVGLEGITALLASPNGSFWVGTGFTGKGGGLQKFDSNTGFKRVRSTLFDTTSVIVNSLLLDRDGGVWIGTLGQGIYHIHDEHTDRFGTDEGLSSNTVLQVFEDHEGTIWVTTTKGIDSFHQLPVISYSKRDGLSNDNVASVLVSRDDTVWLANGDSLDSINHGHISSVRFGHGLPGHNVTALFEDHANRLWVGVDNDLYVYEHNEFQQVQRKDGKSTRFIVGITEDTGHNVWAEVSGSNRELIRIQNRKVVAVYPESMIPSARTLAADGHGGIWLGLRNGDLARFQDGHADVFRVPRDIDSDVRQIIVNSDDSVFATAAFGLVVWRSGKIQTLNSRNGLPCDGTIGVTWDGQETLWLYMECGLVRIERADLQKWFANPDARLTPRLFGAFDGVQPVVPNFNPIAKSSDGRLWFANEFGLQSINSNHVIRNGLPPPVHIENVIADRKVYSPVKALRLPPLLLDLEIDYTALSFVNPRAVRFRYRLDGRDNEWQDTGTRRQAFYTDLRPGKYRFRVIACNNDGVWNEQGDVVSFSIAAAWYQTLTFKLSCALSCLIGLCFAYIYQVQRHASEFRLRSDERLNERTRLARDLHDTLLQTIQGSRFLAGEARQGAADVNATQKSLDLLIKWLDRASEEGRAALETLRISTRGNDDLAEALGLAAQECRVETNVKVAFTTHGAARSLHPITQDEVFLIGLEAIQNACNHSHAEHVEIELRYGSDFSLRVTDDGCGMDIEVARQGKAGHYGILGMRERAAKIATTLSIESSPGRGTDILLTIPGKVAFEGTPRTLSNRIMNWKQEFFTRHRDEYTDKQ